MRRWSLCDNAATSPNKRLRRGRHSGWFRVENHHRRPGDSWQPDALDGLGRPSYERFTLVQREIEGFRRFMRLL